MKSRGHGRPSGRTNATAPIAGRTCSGVCRLAATSFSMYCAPTPRAKPRSSRSASSPECVVSLPVRHGGPWPDSMQHTSSAGNGAAQAVGTALSSRCCGGTRLRGPEIASSVWEIYLSLPTSQGGQKRPLRPGRLSHQQLGEGQVMAAGVFHRKKGPHRSRVLKRIFGLPLPIPRDLRLLAIRTHVPG